METSIDDHVFIDTIYKVRYDPVHQLNQLITDPKEIVDALLSDTLNSDLSFLNNSTVENYLIENGRIDDLIMLVNNRKIYPTNVTICYLIAHDLNQFFKWCKTDDINYNDYGNLCIISDPALIHYSNAIQSSLITIINDNTVDLSTKTTIALFMKYRYLDSGIVSYEYADFLFNNARDALDSYIQSRKKSFSGKFIQENNIKNFFVRSIMNDNDAFTYYLMNMINEIIPRVDMFSICLDIFKTREVCAVCNFLLNYYDDQLTSDDIKSILTTHLDRDWDRWSGEDKVKHKSTIFKYLFYESGRVLNKLEPIQIHRFIIIHCECICYGTNYAGKSMIINLIGDFKLLSTQMDLNTLYTFEFFENMLATENKIDGQLLTALVASGANIDLDRLRSLTIVMNNN